MAYFAHLNGKPTPLEDFVIADTGNATLFPPSSAAPEATQAPFTMSQPSAIIEATPDGPSKSVTFFIDRKLEAEQRYEVYEDAKLFGTIRVRSCLPTGERFQVHATMH